MLFGISTNVSISNLPMPSLAVSMPAAARFSNAQINDLSGELGSGLHRNIDGSIDNRHGNLDQTNFMYLGTEYTSTEYTRTAYARPEQTKPASFRTALSKPISKSIESGCSVNYQKTWQPVPFINNLNRLTCRWEEPSMSC